MKPNATESDPMSIAEPRTDSRPSIKAVLSLLSGIVALASGFYAVSLDYPALFAIMLGAVALAIVSGLLARRQVRRSEGRVSGRGMAAWGVGFGTLGLVFVLLLPAV